jgi:hypothetical protein
MKTEFQLDTHIYDIEKIQQGIDDFSEVATIIFQWNILSVDAGEEEAQEIFLEFMNYVLSL